MPRTIQCRRARPEDATAIATAHVRAWQAAYVGHIPDSYLAQLDIEDSRRRWEERLAQIDPNLFVGGFASPPKDAVVGFCGIGPSRDPGADTEIGEIQVINLDPRVWRMGIGRELLGCGVRFLADHGFAQATLWVLEGNTRARAFYEACGWQLDPAPDGRKLVTEIASVELPHIRYRRAL